MLNNTIFENIVRNANDIIIVTDVPGDGGDPKIVYVNEAFTRLTGYQPDEAIGKNPRFLQGPNTDPQTREQIRDALKRRQAIRVEIVNYGKAGNEYRLEINLVPLKNEIGQVIYFAAIERDITAQSIARRALVESEERYRTTIASMAEGVVMLDKNGFIVSINDAAQSILGLTRDQMMGRSSVDARWRAIHEDGSPFPCDTYPAMVTLRTGKPCSNVIMGVYKPDDTLTWISINSQPLCYPGGREPYAVIATFHDVTERIISSRMKDEFVSVVSHELRTPLTSIRGALGILSDLSMLADTKQVASMVDIALRNCDRLMFLINDLLDMEKIAAGKLTYHFSALSLDEAIGAALSANAPYAEKFKVQLFYDAPQKPIVVRADPDRLLQILTNLLSNAIKFSGEATTVTVSVDASENEHVKVSVSDQGAGVPDEFRSKVFGKFSQADGSTTRQRGGTGLGLAITKSLVEQHGGVINYYNNVTRGATFYFTLPYGKKAAVHAQKNMRPS